MEKWRVTRETRDTMDGRNEAARMTRDTTTTARRELGRLFIRLSLFIMENLRLWRACC